jgi:broad specificity phosphatase PhoE
MITCYIIRHAEKEKGDYYNAHLRHQDEPISRKGREQALKLWPYLCDKQISGIYVSRYVRTAQTIEHVAEQSGITPVMDVRLNEIDNGNIEALTDQEIQEIYPDVWKASHERSTDFRFPEGETGEEARARIADFLEETRQVHSTESIVLVSHEGLIRLLICHIMKIPVYQRWNFHVDFCGIMEIMYQPDYNAWKLIRFDQKLF